MYEIKIYETASENWNWSLSYNNEKMAMGTEGPGGFATRDGAMENLKSVARVFMGCGGLLLMTNFSTGTHDLGAIGGKTTIQLVIE